MLDPRVTAIPGEKGRFLAKSDTDQRIQYMVDLAAENGEGECDCEAFMFSAKRNRAKGKLGVQRDCKHIQRCRREHQIMENLGLYDKQ